MPKDKAANPATNCRRVTRDDWSTSGTSTSLGGFSSIVGTPYVDSGLVHERLDAAFNYPDQAQRCHLRGLGIGGQRSILDPNLELAEGPHSTEQVHVVPCIGIGGELDARPIEP